MDGGQEVTESVTCINSDVGIQQDAWLTRTVRLHLHYTFMRLSVKWPTRGRNYIVCARRAKE